MPAVADSSLRTDNLDDSPLRMVRSPQLSPSPIETLRLPASSNALPPITEAPPWIADIGKKYRLRITDWVSQAWLLTVSPRRTLDEWATGKRELLNPLRFTAVGMGIELLLDRGGRWLCHIEGQRALHGWQAYQQSFIHGPMGMTLMTCVSGTLIHAVLRRKSKAALRSTIAAALFAHFGPGVFLNALSWLVCLGLLLFRHEIPLFASAETGESVPWAGVVAGLLAGPWLVGALSGVHRVRWWWPVLAYLVLLAFSIAMIVAFVLVLLAATKLFHL